MEFFVNWNESKVRHHSLSGQKIVYFRCFCPLCDKCWYSPELEECIYGGPYSGYEKPSMDTPENGAETLCDLVAKAKAAAD